MNKKILFSIFILALLFFVISTQNPILQDPIHKEAETDSTAPLISCNIKTKTLLPGETISIDSLGIRAHDASKIESLAFTKIRSDYFYTGLPEDEISDMRKAYQKGISFHSEEFQFAYGGIYTLTIGACDIYQNCSEIEITIKVEEPPMIEAPTDFYVAEGYKIDFTEQINAWDFLDEDFSSDDLKIDSSSVNFAKAGSYPVFITGTDNYGLSQSMTATVHVHSQEELQQLINTHQINISEQVIIGAYNTYDMGYFDNSDSEMLNAAITPAMVHIENLEKNTSGNGFIIKIDEEMVTICTCAHVTANGMTQTVIFEDGSSCLGSVVRYDEAKDVSFIQIPIDGNSENTSLAKEYVKRLRTVHIDEVYWKENKDSSPIIVSSESDSDSSGTAVVDYTGRLLGMFCSSDSKNGTTIPLNEILRQYELTFKKKLQYQ